MHRRFMLGAGLALLTAGCGRTDADAGSQPAEQPREVGRAALRPWPEAASVRLFVRRPYEEGKEAGFIEPSGRLLQADVRRAMEAALVGVGYDREPSEAAACFVPHHFLRYFDGAGGQIGEIAICFCCAGVRVMKGRFEMPDVAGARYSVVEYTADLEKQILALGLPTNVDCG